VLTLGYLATNSKGQTLVVVAMLGDPAAALSPSAQPELLAIVLGAFERPGNPRPGQVRPHHGRRGRPVVRCQALCPYAA
jgi:hypothetical protein